MQIYISLNILRFFVPFLCSIFMFYHIQYRILNHIRYSIRYHILYHILYTFCPLSESTVAGYFVPRCPVSIPLGVLGRFRCLILTWLEVMTFGLLDHICFFRASCAQLDSRKSRIPITRFLCFFSEHLNHLQVGGESNGSNGSNELGSNEFM